MTIRSLALLALKIVVLTVLFVVAFSVGNLSSSARPSADGHPARPRGWRHSTEYCWSRWSTRWWWR